MNRNTFFNFLLATAVFLIVTVSPASAQEAVVDGMGEIAFEEGIAAFEDGDWPLALSKFSEALKVEPDNARAHQYRGVTLLKLNQPAEAVKNLEKSRNLDPTAEDVNLDLGAAYQKSGRIDEAEKAYREEVKNHPDSASAHFSLGYLLFSRKKYTDSIPSFSKAGELDPELAAPAQFYVGSALYKMGKMNEAAPVFKNLLAKGASPEIEKAANKYLEAIKAQKTSRKNWGVMGSLLYQYDSNVVAASENAEFPIFINDEEISGEEDSRGVITLSGFYRYVDLKPWTFEGRYAFYQSWHAELDMFNLQYHAPAVTLGRTQKLAEYDTLIALDYRFGYSMLSNDFDWYNLNHWITPSFRIKWNENLASSVGYVFNIEDFEEDQPNRDNVSHSVFEKVDWVFLPKKASLSAILGIDFEDSDDAAYNVRRYWVKLALGARLPLKISTRLSVAYEFEDHYDDDVQDREDNTYTIEFLVLRPIWGPIEGTVGISYKNNDSSVDSLTYDRFIAGGGVVVRY